MTQNAAMVEAAQIAEENMDVFRRGLERRAAKRRAAERAELNGTPDDGRDTAARKVVPRAAD